MPAPNFELELYGPSGSGKSAFFQFIMKACSESEEWTAEKKTFPSSGCRHYLVITNVRSSIPERREVNK